MVSAGAPLHGFRDTDDDWTRSCSRQWLSRVDVPTLLINARNDPFLPAHALPSSSDVSGEVQREFPDEGGHAGFVTGAFPGHIDWPAHRIISFFEHRL